MDNNTDNYSFEVSSDFSRAIATYIKDKYNLDLCAYVSTKKLYTLLDLQAIQMETFLKDLEIRENRIKNFVLVGALKACNTDKVFYQVAEQWSDLDNGVVIITPLEIKLILNELDKKSSLDSFADCVIITVMKVDDAYMMVGDFVTFSIV